MARVTGETFITFTCEGSPGVRTSLSAGELSSKESAILSILETSEIFDHFLQLTLLPKLLPLSANLRQC
jgi:hypothetical protein